MTKYSEIYNRAMFRFSDYSFLNLEDEIRNHIMQNFLKQAIVDFKPSCKVNLENFNDELEEFNEDVGDEEQEILALGIAYYWLSHKALNSELLRNTMLRKDYNTYSPANLLKEICSLRDELRKEYRGKINEYSFRYSDLDNLKVGGGTSD